VKRNQWLLLILARALMHPLYPDEVTVILQDGLNMYDGCHDSYIFNDSAGSNYGNRSVINVAYEAC
jgi:hypothetical protein